MDLSRSDLTFKDIFKVLYKNDLKKKIWIVGNYSEFNSNNLNCIKDFTCNECRNKIYYISNNLLLANIVCLNCKSIKFRCVSCDKACRVKKYHTYFNPFNCSSCDNKLINIYNSKDTFLDEDTKNEICKEIFTSCYLDNTI
jgi:hypothetical protein